MRRMQLTTLLLTVLPVAGVAQRTPVNTTAQFEFHSDRWINLHHFLYHWTNQVIATERGREPGVAVPDVATAKLSAKESEDWNRAVTLYREFAAEDLLYGKKVRAITDALIANRPAEPDWSKLPVELSEALRAAGVVYRQHWWLTHDLMNRRWLKDVAPEVSRLEDIFVKALPRLYGGTWPTVPHVIDISALANQTGGYTTNDPDHTVVSSNEAGYKGMAGVELVFHEVSHAASLETGLIAVVKNAFREADRTEPGNFWHSLLFYTTGEITAQLAASQKQQYTMLAAALGMFDNPGWRGYRQAFDTYWRPAIAGTDSPARALRKIVLALPMAPRQ